MKENIERLFNEDIREKRKAGSGSYHRKGHGVKHGMSGALKTPFFYMKTKERNKLNGEVEVSNMYSTILNWNEWNLKDKETQKTLMTKWREVYSNSQIMEQLQIGRAKHFNAQSFADIVNDLGCPAKIRGGSKPKTERKTKAATASITPQLEMLEFETPEKEIKTETVKQILITNGLHLEYNGEYDQEQLSKIFTKLQLLIEGEPNKFKISLSLSECD